MRHGESTWNRSLRLTGWADVPLSPRGHEQAQRAGRALRERGFIPDQCFTSRLRRATETRDGLLAALGAAPARHERWRLNERHYGALQGLRWWQALLRYGLGAVRRCKSEFDVAPPLVPPPPAASVPPDLPAADREDWLRAQRGESLADALRRFLPLWETEIEPALRRGERVLVVAHNNILRGLMLHLDGGGGRPQASLVTAQPWLLELDATLHVVRRTAL